TQVLLAAGPVRPDREAMRLVAQPLDEVEHRIARLEHEGRTPRHMEGLPSGVAVGSLGHTDKRYVSEAKRRKRLLRGGELAPSAVDDHEIRPGGFGSIRAFLTLDIRLARHLLRYPLPLRERVPERAKRSEGG